MAKLTSFSDFIGGEENFFKPIQPKPYIYVIKYIIGKEDYIDELKDYIINYQDEESDYEDDESYDPFMKKLKLLVEEDNFDEIEEMILNYESYEDDFDEDDDDFEERMYDREYVEDEDVFSTEDDVLLDYVEAKELERDIEASNLSDELKDFLKVDIEFEDLEDMDDEQYFDEPEEYELENAEEIDYEEIVDEEAEQLENQRPSYLDKLPLFPHTKDGKKLSKQQLENLIEIVKEIDKEDKNDDTIKINGEYE